MTAAAPPDRRPVRLAHPLPLGAALLLAVNDHLLKGAGLLPGWLTGKLSDLAGLFFFPVLLAAVLERAGRLLRRPLPARVAAGWAVASTGAVFSAVKLWPGFNAAAAAVLGRQALDPTDLLALPALAAAWAWLRVPARPSPDAPGLLERAALAAMALASVATSCAPLPSAWDRSAVHWKMEPASGTFGALGCAALDADLGGWDQEHFALALYARAGPGGCDVGVQRADLRLGDRWHVAEGLPLTLRVAAGEQGRLVLVFPLAAREQCQGGARATAELAIWAGDVAARRTVALACAIGTAPP